jgi:hypothetical protein
MAEAQHPARARSVSGARASAASSGRRAGRAFAVAALCCWLGLLAGCGRSKPNATPEGAVRELVEQLARYDGNPRDAEQLFDLLSERSKKNLRARAERYGAASGRKIAPAAMLVPSRMAPRFTPQSYRAQVSGSYATVDVAGVTTSERAQIACVFEEGAWRVDLVLPELPPLRRRPGGEP